MSEERLSRDVAGWEMLAAGVCFVVAVLSLAIGFVLTTRWLLNDQLHPLLHAVGLVLLVIGIPIMLQMQNSAMHTTLHTIAESFVVPRAAWIKL